MDNINWKLILDKIGTVAVDRRFWVAVLTLVGILLGLPQLADNADSLSAELVDAIILIAQILGLIFIPTGLTLSWANRPPSGLRFKEPSAELTNRLRDLGIE